MHARHAPATTADFQQFADVNRIGEVTFFRIEYDTSCEQHLNRIDEHNLNAIECNGVDMNLLKKRKYDEALLETVANGCSKDRYLYKIQVDLSDG